MCDMRIVDDSGKELPHDGKTMGHLQVRVKGGGSRKEVGAMRWASYGRKD